MPNTIVYGLQTIGITPDGATDYDICADTTLGSPTDGMYIKGVVFKPSAVNDKICILDGAGGPPILFETDTVGGGLQVWPYHKLKLFFDASECTFGVVANVRITIYFAASPSNP